MSAASVLLAAALASGQPVETAATNAVSGAAAGEVRDMARIKADTTYYDRKEGMVAFKGHVHVDDSDYQMHTDVAYVFLTGSNTLDRIAAIGSVAMTNGTRRAYGEKLTYRRDSGLVVLHGGDVSPALVVDETPSGDRTVRGSKIRLWINSEQVEAADADISAPRAGAKQALPILGPTK